MQWIAASKDREKLYNLFQLASACFTECLFTVFLALQTSSYSTDDVHENGLPEPEREE